MGRPLKTTNQGTQTALFKEAAPPAAGSVLKTQKDVAEHYKVALRTVGNWIAEDMPRTDDGFYDTHEITPWLIERGYGPYKGASRPGQAGTARRAPTKNGEDPDNGEPDDFQDKEFWEREYLKERTAKVQLETAIKLGEYVLRVDVEARSVKQIMAVKQELLGLSNHLAPQLVGQDAPMIAEIIDTRIREIIQNFSGEKEKEELNHEGTKDAEKN